jgi:hypothetical protein
MRPAAQNHTEHRGSDSDQDQAFQVAERSEPLLQVRNKILRFCCVVTSFIEGRLKMAQIFISHSAKDRPIIEFINRAFATTKVEAKYEEILLAHRRWWTRACSRQRVLQ